MRFIRSRHNGNEKRRWHIYRETQERRVTAVRSYEAWVAMCGATMFTSSDIREDRPESVCQHCERKS